MTSLSPRISVIIVNYGVADLAIAAAESVLVRNHGGRVVDVHVVDNASPGDDAIRLRDALEDRAGVYLYLEDENHGFGRGNNLVFRALAARSEPPDYVFLLNPDAQLENEALDLLATCLDTRPEVAAVGAGISLPSGVPVTAAFRFPSVLAEFIKALAVGPVDRLFARWRVALPPNQPRGPVDWVAGAAVMFRRSVLDHLEGFDPVFFLYYEEVELMHRIATAGHAIWYLPEARVLHAEGAATQVRSGEVQRKPKPAYWYDSWRYYFAKTHGVTGALAAAFAWYLGAGLNRILAVLRGQTPSAPLHFFRDLPRLVIWPLLTGRSARG